MIRAVLDTNIVVSALLFEGVASRLVPGWQQGRITLLVSKALLDEYLRVFHYPKFRLTTVEVRHLVYGELLPFVTPVKVARTPRVLRSDPADNHVLACALAGAADLVVTGDHHLLALRRYRTIPIVPLSAFLQQLGIS